MEELDYSEEERESTEEVELTVSSSEIPDGTTEGKLY